MHVRKTQEEFPLKTGSGQELCRLHDHLQKHIRVLIVSGEYEIKTYLTLAIELKLDKGTKLRWTEHSSKCETMPPCKELFEFLDVQARHHESIAHSTRSVPKVTPRSAYIQQGQTMHVWYVRKKIIRYTAVVSFRECHEMKGGH